MLIPARLLTLWADPVVRQLPPASAAEVALAFAKLGPQPTADVVSLYEQIGGMEVPDHEEWRLWSLEELVTENSSGTGGLLGFSDYLMGCWVFYLEPVSAEVSRVLTDYGKGSLVEAAPSLATFIEALSSAPLQVLDPKAALR